MTSSFLRSFKDFPPTDFCDFLEFENLTKATPASLVAKKQAQFFQRFFEMVNSCTYLIGTEGKIEQNAAFQKAIALLKEVKQKGGIVYVIKSGKDKVSSHFTTDLMKGLEITAETISFEELDLRLFKEKDLIVVSQSEYDPSYPLVNEKICYFLSSLQSHMSLSKQRPQVITVSEGIELSLQKYGDLNFSIPASQDSALTKMTRLYILHTVVDLYLRPKSNVQERISELTSCTTLCTHTDEKGYLITSEVFTKKALKLIDSTRTREGKVYVIGNGGSDQIAGDIRDQLKTKDVFARTLTANSCLTTCLSNDKGYEQIFSYQFKRCLNSEDLVIAISSSGKSPNIVNAVQTAKEIKAAVITLSGFKKENPLSRLGKLNLHIDREDYGLVEIGHFLVLLNLVDAVVSK